MSKWPRAIKDWCNHLIYVEPCPAGVAVQIDQGQVVLTPAQSATLRAALEAAEQEMS